MVVKVEPPVQYLDRQNRAIAVGMTVHVMAREELRTVVVEHLAVRRSYLEGVPLVVAAGEAYPASDCWVDGAAARLEYSLDLRNYQQYHEKAAERFRARLAQSQAEAEAQAVADPPPALVPAKGGVH